MTTTRECRQFQGNDILKELYDAYKNGAANDGMPELSHGTVMEICRLHGDRCVPVVADLCRRPSPKKNYDPALPFTQFDQARSSRRNVDAAADGRIGRDREAL